MSRMGHQLNKSYGWRRPDTLETMSLENIMDYQKELGFYIGLKERVKNLITAAHIDIILHLTRYKIEENCEDVTRYREWKKELI